MFSAHPCSACNCETSALMGKVTDEYGLPLVGASITHASSDAINETSAILTTYTDITGWFSMAGVCATPQLMRVTKPRYSSVQGKTTCESVVDGGNCSSTFDARISRLGNESFISLTKSSFIIS